MSPKMETLPSLTKTGYSKTLYSKIYLQPPLGSLPYFLSQSLTSMKWEAVFKWHLEVVHSPRSERVQVTVCVGSRGNAKGWLKYSNLSSALPLSSKTYTVSCTCSLPGEHTASESLLKRAL